MKVIIDRFEDSFAVCEREDRNMMDVKIIDLPSGAKEGDVLSIDNGNIIIDVLETEKRRKEIEKLTEDLWE